MTDLERARGIIDETDAAMAELFEKRMDAVKLAAAYKREHGLPVFDPEREARNIAVNTARIGNGEYRPYYERFLRAAMEVSKEYQHSLTGDGNSESK